MEHIQHSADHHGSELARGHLTSQRYLCSRDRHQRDQFPDRRQKDALCYFHRAYLRHTQAFYIDEAEQSIHRLFPLATVAGALPWYHHRWPGDRPLIPMQGEGTAKVLLVHPKAC